MKVALIISLCGLSAISMVVAEGEAAFEGLSTIPGRTPYVVEVFTSQGCSSCPPADDAVSLLFEEAAEAGLELYVLAWHVDYWDYLGWRDPFGSSSNSRRQRAYARNMRRDTVYTPQVLINGHAEVSNPYRENSLIEALQVAGRQSTQELDIEFQVPKLSSQSVDITYTQRQPAKANSLLGSRYDIGLLIVESGLDTTPTRGENRGRTLRNNHVVRTANFERLRSNGTVSVVLPEGINRAKSTAVIIAQDRQTQKIVFATSVQL